MKLKSKSQYEARARIARALAHPSRLLLLDALQSQPMCVLELTELVGSDQSTVSKHLAVLRETGLVQVERKGSLSLYSIRCQCLEQFFGCLESVLEENVRFHQGLVQL